MRKSKSPFFSFVIPVYDRTRYVREAILSALAQDYNDFDVIVILDGSPDNTRNIVESLRNENQEKIKVFSYKDSFGTACRARNTGIMYSNAQYISFLDSDDLASPDRLSHTYNLIAERNCDVAYGAVRFLTDEGRNISGIGFGDVGRPAEFTFEDLLIHNRLYTLTVSVRRDVLLKHGGFRPEMRYREDHELWLRLCYQSCSFAASQEIMSIYRIHGGNNELNFKVDDIHWERMAKDMYSVPFQNWGV